MATARDVALIGILVFVFAIGFFVIFFMTNTVIDRMVGISAINSSESTVKVLRGTQGMTERLDYVIFGLFIGLVLAMIITSWFVGANTIFIVLYFIIVVVSVTFSTVLSNVWEQVSTMAIFGTTVNHFAITNNIMLNLPTYMAVVGFLGIVVMFAKPYLSGMQGGGETY